MEHFINLLSNFPTPVAVIEDEVLDLETKEYVQTVDRVYVNSASVSEIRACANDILSMLEPSKNSIGSLAAIQILLNATPSECPTIDRHQLLDAIVDFILDFNPLQIRYVGNSFLRILTAIGGGALFSPSIAVNLLATAILKIDPTGSMFTTTHLALVKLAYNTYCIEPVIDVINRGVISYPSTEISDTMPLCNANLSPSEYISTATGLTGSTNASMILEYNFLCGMIHMSRRDWKKAASAFEMVILHPTRGENSVSKIMVDAYKKWLLVNLLADGTIPYLPPTLSGSSKSAYVRLAGDYKHLANVFKSRKAAEFKAKVDTFRAMWQEDGNTSLVREVIEAFHKWVILDLRKVYQRVSIAQIRNAISGVEDWSQPASTQEVMNILQGMMESDMLGGDVEMGDGDDDTYVTFNEEENSILSEKDVAQEISRIQQNIKSLGYNYKAANGRLMTTKEYVVANLRETRMAEKAMADGERDFETQIEDEDLMTGVMVHD